MSDAEAWVRFAAAAKAASGGVAGDVATEADALLAEFKRRFGRDRPPSGPVLPPKGVPPLGPLPVGASFPRPVG